MIIPCLLLVSLGVVVIFTSDPVLAIQQALYALVGVVLFFLLRRLDYRSLASFIKPAYVVIIALLIITFILGLETRGSVRWIPLGLFNLQPSEFAKPVIIVLLAYFWSNNYPSWLNILKSFLIVSPIFLLVFRQPDLGTTLTLLFIWGGILLASNISIIKIGILTLAAAIITPLSWFFLRDYQRERILSFISPAHDPQGIGFHVIQSMIAVGSGQLLGRGLGRGTQSRLQFLPEFRTDFIFAFIAEELGFIGTAIVLILYTAIFVLCFRLIRNTGSKFGELIIIGVLSMLFFQITVNIGMNIGILPITGITLPLLSYGGSSLITTFICFGIVASVAKYSKLKSKVDTFSL